MTLGIRRFSALQRAENSSILVNVTDKASVDDVSVLFSEPKIPQSPGSADGLSSRQRGFSALQRAENSSIPPATYASRGRRARRFSALQRAENSSIVAPNRDRNPHPSSFSALQRAENSSMATGGITRELKSRFQCSSASRKFLNVDRMEHRNGRIGKFQCSSASRKFLNISL